MNQALPYGSSTWLSSKGISELDIMHIVDDAAVSYVLEVDLNYLAHLHHPHNDLPFVQLLKATHAGNDMKKLWNRKQSTSCITET